MDSEKKSTLLLSVLTLTGDLRKMVENGRKSYQSAPDINDFVKSHGSEELYGLLLVYPVNLYVECFKTAGVRSRKELEDNWSRFFTDTEVRESVEDLIAAEESYIELISELDKAMQDYEERTALPVVEVGGQVALDIPVVQTLSGDAIQLGSYLEKSTFTLFILRKHYV